MDVLPAEDEIMEVIEKYKDMIYKLALLRTKNEADAEDVLQDVICKYFQNNLEFKSEEHKKAWLIRVTVNCSKRLFRSAWYRKTVQLEDNIQYNDEERDVYYSVLQLPLKYRTVIHLYYYEDMSIADISKILNIKESTIKSQLHRAKSLLKNKLEGEYDNVRGSL